MWDNNQNRPQRQQLGYLTAKHVDTRNRDLHPVGRRRVALDIYNIICRTRTSVLGDLLDAVELILEEAGVSANDDGDK